jgi:acetoacetate decarboxylase
MSDAPKTNPGEIIGVPILKIDYPTDPANIAALLPPGIEPSSTSNVHLSVYCVPVPDEPEYGVMITIDADHRGTEGFFCLGYAIDQESAVHISRDMNGQPKYLAEIDYYRIGPGVSMRVSHQGYTFAEFKGQTTAAEEGPQDFVENEWWVKVSRAVGGAEKAYDFPPHVVHVKSTYSTMYQEKVEGELTLRESPWDPIASLLPMSGPASARLWTPTFLGRDITLGAPLDPDAFWPHADTISGSRWPGTSGGPRR